MFLNGEPFHWTTMNATNALFVFTGISYMTSLFGGWLADSTFGKFPTLILSLIVYICGYTFMPLLYPYPVEPDVPVAPEWCAGPNSSHVITSTPKPGRTFSVQVTLQVTSLKCYI